jgi:Spy/CpxP family protein refolding chaperone
MRTLLLVLVSAALAGSVQAQPLGDASPPHPGGGVPPLEAFATIPSLSAAQQTQLRALLLERRDARDAVREKSHEAMDAQRKHDRAEFERIDAQSSERVRKLLGDDGYRAYSEWQLAHKGPRGPEGDRRPPPPRGGDH